MSHTNALSEALAGYGSAYRLTSCKTNFRGYSMKRYLTLFLLPSLAFSQMKAFITNADDDTVSVINLSSMMVVDTIDVGNYPTGTAVHPDGHTVYVANNQGASISVIDVGSHNVQTISPVFIPFAIVFDPSGDFAYVTEDAGAVRVIDASTLQIIDTIVLDPGARDIEISADGAFLYVAVLNTFDGYLAKIDTATRMVVDTVDVGTFPHGVALSTDGLFAYVTISSPSELVIVDLATFAVDDRIAVGSWPMDMAVHPNGQTLYIANLEGDEATEVDLVSGTVSDTVPVGEHPRGINLDLPNGRIFVVCETTNQLDVIDVATFQIIDTVDVGLAPWGWGSFIACQPQATYSCWPTCSVLDMVDELSQSCM